MKSAHLSVNYSFLLVKNCLVLLALTILAFEAVTLSTNQYGYDVDEGENVTVACFIDCTIDSFNNVFWYLQVPKVSKSGITRLDDKCMLNDPTCGTTRIEAQYGVEIEFRNDSSSCTNGNKTNIYLDIAGVKANMSHSVLHCGIDQSNPLIIGAGIYIFVKRIEPVVMAINEVNYATDNAVTISCRHSCNWTSLHSDYLLLWKLNIFYNRDLGALELHDNYSKTMAEDELEVKFSMTSDDACSLGNDFSTFFLHIMNVNASLQHAVVSCGVRVDMNSPEIYSSTDSYIVINETKCITTDIATTPTTSDEATTSTASDDITTPTTNGTAIAEPPDRVVEIAVPAAIVALLFGLVTGGLVSGLTVYLLTKRTKLDKMVEAHNVEVNMAVAASNPINKETFEESEQSPVKDCR